MNSDTHKKKDGKKEGKKIMKTGEFCHWRIQN